MRVALISDLHANVPALEAVLEDIGRVGADRVICLGDIVDLGPQPGETVERLRDIGCACIKGNHDPLDEGPAIPMLAAIEDWTRERLSAEDLAWLDALPMELMVDVDGAQMLCVHGSPNAFTDNVLDSTPDRTLRKWIGKREFDVMVCGHTHVQLLRRMGRQTIVNVGSVGMPFEKAYDSSPPTVCPWAEYGIVGFHANNLTVDLRRVAFDLRDYRAAVEATGFPHAEAWLAHWVHA